jgi:Na+/proline symporter
MSKLQNVALGLVLVAIGFAALLQILPADRVLRLVSIGALGTVSILGAMVFFVFALRGNDQSLD